MLRRQKKTAVLLLSEEPRSWLKGCLHRPVSSPCKERDDEQYKEDVEQYFSDSRRSCNEIEETEDTGN